MSDDLSQPNMMKSIQTYADNKTESPDFNETEKKLIDGMQEDTKQDGMPDEIFVKLDRGMLYFDIAGRAYIHKDKYDEVVEQLDLTGQQMTKLAMALDKVMDENERLREVEYMYKEMCELMGET